MIRKNLDAFETLRKIENELGKSWHLIRFLLKISGWTRQFPGGNATLLPKISQLCPGDWEPIATVPVPILIPDTFSASVPVNCLSLCGLSLSLSLYLSLSLSLSLPLSLSTLPVNCQIFLLLSTVPVPVNCLFQLFLSLSLSLFLSLSLPLSL